MAFLKPYYRNIKSVVIKEIAKDIQTNLIEGANIDKAMRIAMDNNVCAIIYNYEGKPLYQADFLGANCIFSQNMTIGEDTFRPDVSGDKLTSLIDPITGEFIEVFTAERGDQEMIVYGKQIELSLGSMYLFVNSPLEPLDSTVAILSDQFLFVTFIVLALSGVISLFISTKLAKPIVKMKYSADELSKGNYQVNFEGSYFREINELAGTLNDATNKLSKVDELRKDLIANVSHDIKTPLTMIKAYAEMIKDISGNNPAKREEHLDVIVKEVDYLDHLVMDMQELSKMQSGTYELNETIFNLKDRTQEIVILFQAMVDQHDFNLVVECDDDCIVCADEIKIGQVLYNFINNALKHSSNGKTVTVKVYNDDKVVKAEVHDEGSGIDEKDLPYIWDRYYKIDKKFQRNASGSGLGLAIVKAILDTHHAKYGVSSKVDEGSVFWFELPGKRYG